MDVQTRAKTCNRVTVHMPKPAKRRRLKKAKILPKAKWNFAIGTMSLVPRNFVQILGFNMRPSLHYLIVDIDTTNQDEVQETEWYLCNHLPATNVIGQPTPNGWHFYTNLKLTWPELLYTLRQVPHVDKKWLAIGERRGYLYLADKNAVSLPWPVTRMILHTRKTR